jgi:hypothetical protein
MEKTTTQKTIAMASWLVTKLIVFGFMTMLTLAVAYPQNTNTGALELANIWKKVNQFVLGIQIGNVTIAPGNGSYTLNLPSNSPTANSFLGFGADPTTLAFVPSCSGFAANGDLGGNATSQQVVGINGIPIDTTSTPQDGYVLKYVASAGKIRWSAE